MPQLCIAVLITLVAVAGSAQAQQAIDAQWIWWDEGDPLREAPAGKVWFRRQAAIDGPCTGFCQVACDDRFTLWVNGQKIGTGQGNQSFRFNLNGIVERGRNVIAVEAENITGRAGLLVDGEVRHQDGRSVPFDTDSSWKYTREAPQGDAWLRPGFNDPAWKPAKVLARHAESPWRDIAFGTGELDRFHLAEGFRLQRIAEPQQVGSLVCITWGNRGRLMASVERGPVLSLFDSNRDGTYDKAVTYTKDVTNCQGLCTVGDDLYAVGNGPEGTGIYRLPDRNHDDQADEVQLVVKHRGGMGEHGPHNVILGPDGWLYHNSGNHAWITNPPEPASPVTKMYEADVLAPKFEDAGGHAVGIKVPGGTIWRFTPDGQKWWLHTAGFRNAYDFAFNAAGDLFSFDSDMEWDVGLPWYRPVRVNHCTPGADFGWRSGAGKWPVYFFDALPGTVDIGRGSPTGVIFYEHQQFPERYQGAFLVCDWSMGRIIATFLKPQGASFAGRWETLVAGNPLNVSDIEVDRDGSVVFSTGGRNTQGGIYRLTYGQGSPPVPDPQIIQDVLHLPQFASSWARELAAAFKAKAPDDWALALGEAACNGTPQEQIRALTLLAQLGPQPDADLLVELAADADAPVRAFAAWLLGDHQGAAAAETLGRLLADSDPHVRRRACEAFVRSGQEPPLAALLKMLASTDRFERYAARLALERIPVEKWRQSVLESDEPHVFTHGMLALYRLDQLPADEGYKLILANLEAEHGPEVMLEYLRLAELLLCTGAKPEDAEELGEDLARVFVFAYAVPQERPPTHTAVLMEIARVLAALGHKKAPRSLLAALEVEKSPAVQIHYALCLAYCQEGWEPQHQAALLDWYETTPDWEGGHSFSGYLANIVMAAASKWPADDRQKLMAQWQTRPFASNLLVRLAGQEDGQALDQILARMISDIEQQPGPAGETMLSAAIEALGRSRSPDSKATLRKLFDQHADRRDLLARAIAQTPRPDDFPYLIRSLQSGNATTTQICLQALGRLRRKATKPEEWRAAIIAGLRLGDAGGLAAASVLAEWTGEPHPGGKPIGEVMAHYQQVFARRFPNEPPAELPKDDASKNRYTLPQLVSFLESDRGRQGDVPRGSEVFHKANCAKCHKLGSVGTGVGPDLTTLRRRFQRSEIIEAILFPSAIISDQYKSLTVRTTDGLIHTGMPLQQPGTKNLVLLLPDATRIEIPPDKIDVREPAKISVMPEGALKDISLEELADLFAFLETTRFSTEPGTTTPAASPERK